MKKYIDIKKSLENKLRRCIPSESSKVTLTGEESAVAWDLIQKYQEQKELLEAVQEEYSVEGERQEKRLNKIGKILNLAASKKVKDYMFFHEYRNAISQGFSKETALKMLIENAEEGLPTFEARKQTLYRVICEYKQNCKEKGLDSAWLEGLLPNDYPKD